MPSNISVGLGLYKSFDFEGFDADQAAQGPQAGRGQGQGHGEGVAGKSANVSEAVRGLGKTNSRVSGGRHEDGGGFCDAVPRPLDP